VYKQLRSYRGWTETGVSLGYFILWQSRHRDRDRGVKVPTLWVLVVHNNEYWCFWTRHSKLVVWRIDLLLGLLYQRREWVEEQVWKCMLRV
jgi:hypothetical protein